MERNVKILIKHVKIEETRPHIEKKQYFYTFSVENRRTFANIIFYKVVQDRSWSILGASGAQKTTFRTPK